MPKEPGRLSHHWRSGQGADHTPLSRGLCEVAGRQEAKRKAESSCDYAINVARPNRAIIGEIGSRPQNHTLSSDEVSPNGSQGEN